MGHPKENKEHCNGFCLLEVIEQDDAICFEETISSDPRKGSHLHMQKTKKKNSHHITIICTNGKYQLNL